MLGPHKNRNGHWVRKSLDRFRPQVQMCDDCFLTFFPHTVKDVLRIGLVLRYLALGRGRTLRVDTTSGSQLRRHSGWSLALGRRYRSALELETSPRAASLLPLGLLP
jgi:hypothetical protein